jgi:hypothetical protein
MSEGLQVLCVDTVLQTLRGTLYISLNHIEAWSVSITTPPPNAIVDLQRGLTLVVCKIMKICLRPLVRISPLHRCI